MFLVRYKQTSRIRANKPIVDVTIKCEKGVPDNYLIGVVENKIEIGAICNGQMHLPPKELILQKEAGKKCLTFSLLFSSRKEAMNYITLIEKS